LTLRSAARLLVALPGLGLRSRYRRLQVIALVDSFVQNWVSVLLPRLYVRFRLA
jgi:hypothetical protein